MPMILVKKMYKPHNDQYLAPVHHIHDKMAADKLFNVIPLPLFH